MPESDNLYVILHGHFYQPPREDPGTDEIDRQPSAFPYHDWNERISKECYAANAASRILDGRGRILEIINNYSYISFNFGPTLLKWLKRNDEFTYSRIIEADGESMKRNRGHGNAIAQVYNHIIMPLASDDDIRTEIEWGILSFEKDFKRDPEGMWLSEMAVSDRVAEFLISEGIKFIILTPEQGIETSGGGLPDPSKPYFLQEKNGNLAVFFTYSDIAAKISFEHILWNADFLRNEILMHRVIGRKNQLIHTATDGESYGHHEPFGDMCLARLIFDNRTKNDFIITNYSEYLEINPPVDYASLKEGGEGRGTSWSCPHGVGRWYKDCGCSTGGKPGWDQKWRMPLRQALDYLRDTLFESSLGNLSSAGGDIRKLRREYHNVIYADNETEREKAGKLLLEKETKTKPGSHEAVMVLKLCEAMHDALLMYTSCGWFFADISGIETLQNLKYAWNVFELAGDMLPEETLTNFLGILRNANSNNTEFYNGEWMFKNRIIEEAYDENKLILELAIKSAAGGKRIPAGKKFKIYFYDVDFQLFSRSKKKDWAVYKTMANVHNGLLLREKCYIAYLFIRLDEFYFFINDTCGSKEINYYDSLNNQPDRKDVIELFQRSFPGFYKPSSLTYDVREFLLSKVYSDVIGSLHISNKRGKRRIEEILGMVTAYNRHGILMKKNDLTAAEDYFNNIIFDEIIKLQNRDISKYDFSYLVNIIKKVRIAGLKIDFEDILPHLQDNILKRLDRGFACLDTKELNNIEKLIDFANESTIDFEKYEIQNIIYLELTRIINKKGNKNAPVHIMKTLTRIAEKFNIAPDFIV